MHVVAMLAYDAVLILLQRRQLAVWLLKLDEEHATCGREEQPVRHSSTPRRCELIRHHAHALGVEARGSLYLGFFHKLMSAESVLVAK